MATREFAAYSYDTGSSIKTWFVSAAIVSAILAMIMGANLSPYCFFFLVVPLFIAIHLWRAEYDKTLLVSNRYMILGEDIVYFRNVASARIDKGAETLTVFFGKGRSMVISSSRFPTNARKPDKIRLNRSNKFTKVSDRIVSRLKDNGVQVLVT